MRQVSNLTGVSKITITKGIQEIENGAGSDLAHERCRGVGGGRRITAEKFPGIKK